MKDRMTIILFSGELDKAIAAFILATTAAASGMEVSIFFTFWGLNLLKKSKFAITKSQHLMQKMFNFMSTTSLPLTRLNMFGVGPWMLKKLMKKTKMPSIQELMKLAKQLNVKFIACTTSCSVMGISKEHLISEVDEFVGASAYLEMAKDSKINLFI